MSILYSFGEQYLGEVKNDDTIYEGKMKNKMGKTSTKKFSIL